MLLELLRPASRSSVIGHIPSSSRVKALTHATTDDVTRRQMTERSQWRAPPAVSGGTSSTCCASRATSRCRSRARLGVDVITGEGLDEALAGVSSLDRRLATGADARPGGGDRVLHDRDARTCRGGPGGRRGADGRGVDHRHRQVQRRLQRRQARPGAGLRWKARSRCGSCARRSSTSSSSSSCVGPPGRRRLRAGDAHAARRGARASPRRSSTSRDDPPRCRARSGRSPARARSAWSRWRGS